MQPFDQFFEFLNRFVTISPEEFAAIIEPRLQLRCFKRKEVITPAGTIEQYFNFIEEGLARKYFKKEAEEVITQISLEGHMIHAQESFHSQTLSDYCVEAIEATTLISITYDDLNEIFATNAKMERLGRLIITGLLVITHKWQMNLLKLSPRERFIEFFQRNPHLVQRVPQKYLASLLNIQPETFSRFKHLLRVRT